MTIELLQMVNKYYTRGSIRLGHNYLLSILEDFNFLTWNLTPSHRPGGRNRHLVH